MKNTNIPRIILIAAFVLLFCNNSIYGIEIIKPLSQMEIKEFNLSLKQKSDTTISFTSSFSQEKSLEMLSRKMVSKGIFKYKKEDKIAFLYELPFKYYLIINGNKLKIDNDGKKQIIDLTSNPLMKQMRSLIEASFLGKLSEMGDSYKINYSKDNNNIFVNIVPANKSISDMIQSITITFSKIKIDILEIKLEEGANSITKYIFSEPLYNTIKNDEGFNIY